jgi:PAS domain S-box-containing protein
VAPPQPPPPHIPAPQERVGAPSAEARLLHLARVSALVTAINKEIVRVGNAHDLYQRACRVAVERGGYRFAWVGLLDAATNRIAPVARFGFEDGYLDEIRIDLNDEALSSGPVGTAFRTVETGVVNDIANDPSFRPWRERAQRRGYGSCAAFPLCRNGVAIGVLAIYSREAAPFDEESLALMRGLADDMSFALDMLDHEEGRRAAERALRDSEERYRTVVEQASDGIFVADEQRRLVDVNSAAEKLTGYARAELLAMTVPQLFDPEELRARPLELRTLPPGHALMTERRMVRKDGTRIEVEISAKLLTDGREQAFVRNVTDRKALQHQLVMAERMASLGRLAAGVAHEVNNPLAYVVLNLELAADVLSRLPAGPDGDELSRALDAAREGSERVRRIVRSLTTFGRGDDEPLGPVDVHRALDTALQIVESRYRHRARLVRDYRATHHVRASEFRLGQVFVNLIVNAADAIGDGNLENNSIRLTTYDTPDRRVAIEVADTGCGIVGDIRERIFDPFFTTKPIGAGSGLGLSICHGIVASFDGEIALVHTDPGGSTFRVVVPAEEARAPAPDAPERAPRPRPRTRARVLVVDDEPAVTQIIARALDSYDVTVAESGKEARSLCESQRFDVILCDVTMPDFDGIDLWETLHAAGGGLERRMAFMTGGTFAARAREFLARVPNRCIEKPFGITPLEEMIEAVIREQDARGENRAR